MRDIVWGGNMLTIGTPNPKNKNKKKKQNPNKKTQVIYCFI